MSFSLLALNSPNIRIIVGLNEEKKIITRNCLFCSDDHMETLSTWITPTAYQIVSFAWKLVQVSEGRQGEREAAASRCNTAQALALRPIKTAFFHTRERRRDHYAPGHKSLCSYHLDSAPPCLTLRQTKASQTISYPHLSPPWHAIGNAMRLLTKQPSITLLFYYCENIPDDEARW